MFVMLFSKASSLGSFRRHLAMAKMLLVKRKKKQVKKKEGK